MCKDYVELKNDLMRAFGHLLKSSDPKVREAAQQFRETQRRKELERATKEAAQI